MNYQKIYDDICKRGQERILPKEVYTEKHHIIPKCLGGGNEKSNISVLTAKEHFICHLLLARKLYPTNPKIWYGLFMLLGGTTRQKENRHIPGSRIFEEVRIKRSEMFSGRNHAQYWHTGEKHPQFNKKKSAEFCLSASERAKKYWAENRELKIINSENNFNQTNNNTISKGKKSGENNPFFGKTHTEQTRQQIRDTFEKNGTVKDENNPNATTILHIETGLIFRSVKSAAKYFNVTGTTIQNRIKRNEFKRIKKTNAKDNNIT